MAFKVQIEQGAVEKVNLKALYYGISGSGKTYSAIKTASLLKKPEEKILVIDTESRKSLLYFGERTEEDFTFDIVSLFNPDNPEDISCHHPEVFMSAIRQGIANGYRWIIVDSLTHCYDWALEEVNTLAPKYPRNVFGPWNEVNPKLNDLKAYIDKCDANIIATCQAKESSEMVEGAGGKKVKAFTLEPVYKGGGSMKFIYDFVMSFGDDNTATVVKSRFSPLSGKIFTPVSSKMTDLLAPCLEAGETKEEKTIRNFKTRIIELHNKLTDNNIKFVLPELDSMTLEELTNVGMEMKALTPESKIKQEA